jgi:type IV pilus assembly protein PilF
MTITVLPRITRQILIIALVGFLSACVTTTTGGFDQEDKDKALNYSLQLARSYIQKQNWDMAKNHLKDASDLDPSSAGVHEALAMVYQNTGEFELAEDEYEQAISLDGSLSRVRLNYSAFLYEREEYQRAIQQLKIVTEDAFYIKRVDAFINLGRCYAQLDDFKQAQQAYERAYLMNRKNLSVIYALADVHFQLEDYSKSLEFYNLFRTNVRQQPPQALWLGIRLANKFEDKNAFSSYSLALKNLYPTSAEYLEFKRVYGAAG